MSKESRSRNGRLASSEELTQGNFREGCCPMCGTFVQGNEAVWSEHNRVLHADGWEDPLWVKAGRGGGC
ncbi:hypothetical protein [Actinopolyspora halophila]|uniref:hypothetical protein n=1 Tax=Actinopolyspora halophila TaxID=1850 RepID=UPI00036F3E22|nr:hypothetical protein [Actinopolyspora halophila]